MFQLWGAPEGEPMALLAAAEKSLYLCSALERWETQMLLKDVRAYQWKITKPDGTVIAYGDHLTDEGV